jgi:hypothetical protein
MLRVKAADKTLMIYAKQVCQQVGLVVSFWRYLFLRESQTFLLVKQKSVLKSPGAR